jgi:ATP-dependent RNA helicase DDX23/PRP28
MFSATMPTEVERIEKENIYAILQAENCDESSGKNKRIEQRVVFMPEGQKKGKLTEELRRMSSSDKVIVFVNAKKRAIPGRFLRLPDVEAAWG